MKMVRPNLTLVILTLTFLGPFHSKSAEESLAGGSRIVDQSKVNQLALVDSDLDNTLSIFSIRGTDVTPQGTVPTRSPRSVAIAPAGDLALVTNSPDNTLSIFSIRGTEVTPQGTVPTGRFPGNVAISPAGDLALVTNRLDNALSTYEISGTKVAPLGTVLSGRRPSSVAISPAGDLALVTNPSDYTLSIYGIRGTKVTPLGTVTTGMWPSSVAISPAGDLALVTSNLDNTLSIFSIRGTEVTPQGTVPTGRSPSSVAISPAGDLALVTSYLDNTLSIFSIRGTEVTPQGTVPTGRSPSSVAIAPVGDLALVTNGDHTLSIFSIRGTEVTPQGTVPTGRSPSSVAIALLGPTQHQVEKAIQKVQPTIPKDIMRLIAQFTTSHIDVLEDLLDRFIQQRSFDMSAAIREVSKLRGSKEKKPMIIFNELLLPFMIATNLDDVAQEAFQEFNQRYPQELNRVQEAIASRLKSTTEELDRAQAELEDMTLRASYEVGVGEEQVAPLRTKVDQLKETQERLDNILRYISQMSPSIPRSI